MFADRSCINCGYYLYPGEKVCPECEDYQEEDDLYMKRVEGKPLPDRKLPKCSEEVCPECSQPNNHLRDQIYLRFFDIYDASPALGAFEAQIPKSKD